MTIRLQEVVRSEVEGGLTGPANPIPKESIDCGCGQLPCPKLVRFATRRLFVGLICWIGFVQAASQAYFYITGSTIARRFHIDPHFMEWLLVLADLSPFVLGLPVAYWGDRIHRASWTGALTLLQSAVYFMLVIPHFTHRVRVIEETENVTHMSLYADDSPELCSAGSSRIIIEENEPCYFTLTLLIGVQLVMGMANVAYYALGVSYIDDNTKKRHVASFIGVIIAVKVIGALLGYVLAWGCLRIDAESLQIVESYKEQLGAWWLGFPILSVLLLLPGLLLTWFPRKLPSEVIEQAAATLLGRTGRQNRGPHRTISQKVGRIQFLPTMGRLFTNKILICNVVASIFSYTALANFIAQENIILESRFHVPRPTGTLLGFSDPLPSRLTANLLQPVLIGLIIIITGLAIAKGKPSAKYIISYSIIVIVLAAVIILTLSFATCDKEPILGMKKRSIDLLMYCNKDCGCSKDADFRPVCDSLGMYTFYSPCHAGCKVSAYVDNLKTYSECSCVEDMTGKGNFDAMDGACDSNDCQIGWLLFEFGTMLAYSLIASTFVGDLLIGLRSVYRQDKAVGIGYWMTWVAIFVHLPGKILYQTIADLTCRHWGNERTICHLHDSAKLGNYLCYLTTVLLFLAAIFKILVWYFCRYFDIYFQPELEYQRGTELQQLMRQTEMTPSVEEVRDNRDEPPTRVQIMTIPEPEPLTITEITEEPAAPIEPRQQTIILKYGPVGPGDRRTTNANANTNEQVTLNARIKNMDSEDELDSSTDDESKKDSSPKVAYLPLEIDSDVESDLSSIAPRSRKRIVSNDSSYETSDQPSTINSSLGKSFPNPDHYGDPRMNRKELAKNEDGSWKTDSFEYAKSREKNESVKKGDFNEVGIPIVNPELSSRNGRSEIGDEANKLKDVKSLIDRYEHKMSQEDLDDGMSVKSGDSARNRLEAKVMPGIPLIAMVPARPSSRQASSGFGSLADDEDKNVPSTETEVKNTASPKDSTKKPIGTLCTDL